MKNFWLGVLATAVGGFLLFLLTTGYSEWRASNTALLRVNIDDHVVTIAEEELEAAKKAKVGAKIMMATVENRGSKRLDSPSFVIYPTMSTTPQDILGFGVADDTGEAAPPPSMIQQGREILVRFDFLEPGQGKVLWLVHNGPQALAIRSTTPGMRIEDVSYQVEDNSLFYFIIFVVCLLCLFVGMIIGDKINAAMLRRIGFDPKEVQELYLKSSSSIGEKNG